MTPKMVMALADALAAEPKGGLEYTAAGWRHPDNPGINYHNNNTVRALVDRGMLLEYGRRTNRRAVITEIGRTRLEQVEEDRS